MAGLRVDLLEQAERELFPNVPYHQLTKDQREQTYVRAKELVLQHTGFFIR